ncbi:MAG: hypothetical protein ABIQ95_08465 [Bdellovibrionia bacterium]
MKNSKLKKILGLGIIVALLATFFLTNPFNWVNRLGSNLKSNLEVQKFQTPLSAQKESNEPKALSNLPAEAKLPSSDSPVGSSAPRNTSETAAPNLAAPALNIPGGPTLPKGPDISLDLDKTKKAPALIADGCFSLTFAHKKLASHEDGEACLLHKNLIVLTHPDQSQKSKINSKSVCMRINGKAVKYSFVPGKTNQVILGAEAGPNAKITASYCVGKAKCSQSCVPEKDQFLSAIGADENTDQTQAVNWDGKKGKAEEDTEVENQMAALNKDLNSDGGDNAQLFAGWILETQTAKCEETNTSGKKVAQTK